ARSSSQGAPNGVATKSQISWGGNNREIFWGLHISTDDRGYSAFGSQITLMQDGRPDANARSSAGLMPSGLSTSSPWPPSASTNLSYRVLEPRSAATLAPSMLCIGCFSSAQIPLLPTTQTTGMWCRTIVSNSMAEKPKAPSPE